jgi:hypothetical protein
MLNPFSEYRNSRLQRKHRFARTEGLHVEVYAHGGRWKDNNGETGQVPAAQAKKGPPATVAVVANLMGKDGWDLTEVISQEHNVYRLSFRRSSDVP